MSSKQLDMYKYLNSCEVIEGDQRNHARKGRRGEGRAGKRSLSRYATSSSVCQRRIPDSPVREETLRGESENVILDWKVEYQTLVGKINKVVPQRSRLSLIQALDNLCNAFQVEVSQYHEVIQDLRYKAAPGSPSANLCLYIDSDSDNKMQETS